jgi:hypothetical protein
MSDQRPAKRSGTRAVLHVYRRDDSHWAWSYQEPDSGIELHSNDDYPTREEASAAARRVYPDLPLLPEAGRRTDAGK